MNNQEALSQIERQITLIEMQIGNTPQTATIRNMVANIRSNVS